ncbi:MAG: sensor histidine kinase [Lachnospiraceae bacterium]
MKKSLNRRLLLFLILCWLVPIAVFFVFTTVYYKDSIIKQTENLMEEKLETISELSAVHFEQAILLAQKPSYDRVWENWWEDYDQGNLGRTDFLRYINSSMKGKFYLDSRFLAYGYFLDSGEKIDCYGSRAGIPYSDFLNNVQDPVQELMDSDSSYTTVKILDGNLFIMRNLYTTSDFRKFGTMVIQLDPNKFFQEAQKEFPGNLQIFINDPEENILYARDDVASEERDLVQSLIGDYDSSNSGKVTRLSSESYNGYLYQQKYEKYEIGFLATVKKSDIYTSLYVMYRITFVMVFLFLPLFIFGIWFLHKQIQSPIHALLKAAQKMEAGEMGVLVEGGETPNMEFSQLNHSFNKMSGQVKYLFDTVYNEKLARKDAQLQALQAQINPHFLNNTLEMMNWQARMANDHTVSKMIEALGTVMNYMTNRTDVRTIRLTEELQCTDAYLYIMRMRFGDRLLIEKKIQEELLGMQVPPLVLQPLVENAIVHGIEKAKKGRIELRVFRKDVIVFLQVINSGKTLTMKELEILRNLIEGVTEVRDNEPGHYTSIGIKNVNKRIHLFYGEEYGLSYDIDENGETVATIRIPFRQNNGEKHI